MEEAWAALNEAQTGKPAEAIEKIVVRHDRPAVPEQDPTRT